MAITTVQTVYGYAKTSVTNLMQGCLTAILSKPEQTIFTPHSKTVKVREVDGGSACSYDAATGWSTGGNGTGVAWVDYTAQNDRSKVIIVDSQDEFASNVVGQTPSSIALMEDFINNHLVAEIDAANIATWYDKIPAANRTAVADGATTLDSTHILGTLLQVEKKIFDSGYKGRVIVFVSSDTYMNIQTAMIDNNAIPGILAGKKQFIIPTGFEADEENGVEDHIVVDIDCIQFNNLVLIKTPENRMYGKIIMRDGRTEGQTAGGYAPNSNATGFCNIKILAIPEVSGFAAIKYQVANLLIPGSLIGTLYDGNINMDINKMNNKMFGNFELASAGINQKADNVEVDSRIIYGADIFSIQRKNCFVWTDTPVA